MPLTRQFGIGFTLILTLVFLATVWINVNSTRHFINDQLASHAQDTATSLGLSIAPYLGKNEDLPLIDTMVNAIFDRGYYQSIVLKSMDGSVLLEKRNPATPHEVPGWFRYWFVISPPLAESEIDAGWTPAGVLTVTSHPGLGYAQLWDTAKQCFWLTLLLFIIGIILLSALFKIITVPARSVMRAAERIAAGQFTHIEDVPKTRELNLMVTAFNKMAGILNSQHKELTAQANTYYQAAYVDPLTQLGNKRALDNALARFCADPEEAQTGALVLIRMSSLAYVNEAEGAQAADNYVSQVARIVSEQARGRLTQVFRPRGADYAVILRALPEAQCTGWVSNLAEALQAHCQPAYKYGCAHVGGAHYSSGMKPATLLEHADAALTAARLTSQKWLMASNIPLKQSHQVWRDELRRVLSDNAVDIMLQPIRHPDGSIAMTECLARFKNSTGEAYLPTAELMAEADKLQLSGELDKLILNNILHLATEANAAGNRRSLAINVATASIADTLLLGDVLAILRKIRAQAAMVVVEIHEDCLQQCNENSIYLAAQLRQINCKLTIERVGSNMAALPHLPNVRPDFIKIDGQVTRNIVMSEADQFYVRSLVTIAHGLDIAVIAELVEDESEVQCLQALFVDYVQGYVVGKPSLWELTSG